MIEYQIEDKKIIMYHLWDLPSDANILPEIKLANPRKHLGWYIKFTDGSNLYTRIVSISMPVIGTEAGLLRRMDIIHCALPKGRWCNYSGVAPSQEHPLVRPYTRNEKSLATRLLAGEQLKYVTPRVKMLALEKAKEASAQMGIGVEECVGNYIRLMKGDGNSALGATDRLMIINGIDPMRLPEDRAMEAADKALTGAELREYLRQVQQQQLVGANNVPAIGNVRGMLNSITQAVVIEETHDDAAMMVVM